MHAMGDEVAENPQNATAVALFLLENLFSDTRSPIKWYKNILATFGVDLPESDNACPDTTKEMGTFLTALCVMEMLAPAQDAFLANKFFKSGARCVILTSIFGRFFDKYLHESLRPEEWSKLIGLLCATNFKARPTADQLIVIMKSLLSYMEEDQA